MTTLEKLEEALNHMQEANSLINDAKKENSSLERYYGYSLEIISQELVRFSDNNRGYLGRNTNLQEIIEAEGETWQNGNVVNERKRRSNNNIQTDIPDSYKNKKRH